MATYRLRLTNGSTVTHQALRVRTDATTLYLEDQEIGYWHPVVEYRLDDVEQLHRRFVEKDGSPVWITESFLPTVTGIRS